MTLNMDKAEITYKRREGTDCDHGINFEKHTTNLAYLRCENLHQQWKKDNTTGVKTFFVANNVDNIGAFDDVVVRVEIPDGNKYQPKMMFVQCKHSQDPNKGSLEKILQSEIIKLFDSFAKIVRILHEECISWEKFDEREEQIYFREHNNDKTKKITEQRTGKKFTPEEYGTYLKNEFREHMVRNKDLFNCNISDCEFSLYSNIKVSSDEISQRNIYSEILNTSKIEFSATPIVGNYISKIKYKNYEKIYSLKDFNYLKTTFQNCFRTYMNQIDDIKAEIAELTSHQTDVVKIAQLLNDEQKLIFQNRYCSSLTENSKLLGGVDNYYQLTQQSTKSLIEFSKNRNSRELFTDETIQCLKTKFRSECPTKISTSSAKLEEMKILQCFVTEKEIEKLIVFIKDKNDLSAWKRARELRLYKNQKNIIVCSKIDHAFSDYEKIGNERFIEIHESRENQTSLNEYATQFSDVTKELILNFILTLQGFPATVKDICGDGWRNVLDEGSICKMLKNGNINVGECLISPECYHERYFIDKTAEKGLRRHMKNRCDSAEIKHWTEQEIVLLENSKVLLLSGPAGIGKSHTLKSLAQKYKKENKSHFVSSIELNKCFNDLKESKLKVGVTGSIEFVANTILKLHHETIEYRLFVNACTTNGTVALFFDAFDEISPDAEEKFSSLLNTLEKSQIKRIFISSRPNFIGKLEDRFMCRSVTFLPLNLEDRKQYLRKYLEKLYQDASSNDAEDIENITSGILKSTEEDKENNLNELLEIPLQLKMLVEIYFDKYSKMNAQEKNSFSFKTDLCSLYTAFIKKHVERSLSKTMCWINMQDRSRKIAINDELNGAEELACKLICPDIDTISLDELDDAVSKMRDRVGILTNIYPPVFLHRTYGEFLAAKFFIGCIQNKNENSSSCITFFCNNVLISYAYFDLRRFINALLCDSNSGENKSQFLNPNIKIVIRWEDGKSSLHIASLEGNAEIVKLLLQTDNSNLNERDIKGQTALHDACKSGCFKTVEILISNGFLINMEDEDQRNTLHFAAEGGNEDIINRIIEKDLKLLRKEDKYGMTAFNFACKYNKTKAVLHLLEYDVGLVNIADNNGNIPIYYATQKGNIEIIKELLTHEKKLLNIKHKDGKCLLHIACSEGHFEVAKLLLQQKSSLVYMESDAKETSLHCAARHGDLNLIKLILNFDHEHTLLNKCNFKEHTPLFCALLNRQTTAVKYFLTLPDCLVNTVENPLIPAAEIGDVEILNTIYEHDNTLLNKVGRNECTPLLCALKKGNSEAAKYLLQLPDCLFSKEDRVGISPIHYASRNGDIDIIKMLFDRDKTQLSKPDNDGKFAIDFAIGGRKNETALFLLSFDDECLNNENSVKTVLNRAIKVGNIELIETLLKRDQTLVNKAISCGSLPLDVAIQRGEIEIVNYLFRLTDSSLILEDNRIKSILNFAFEVGYIGIMKYILKTKPTLVKQVNSNGQTLLHIACKCRRTDDNTAKQLLSYANYLINLYDAEIQNPPHQLAPEPCEENEFSMECNYTLLDDKRNKIIHTKFDHTYTNKPSFSNEFDAKNNIPSLVNVEDINGEIPLHSASEDGKVEIMRLLLERDPTLINKKNYKGHTPLHLACKMGKFEAVRVLLDFSECDVNLTDNEGNTPLHHAAYVFYYVKKYPILSLLVQKNRSLLTKTNSKGQTALHFAVERTAINAIECLLSYDECKADIRDKIGNTPLHYCIMGYRAFKLVDAMGFLVKRTIFFFSKYNSSIINMQNYAGQTPLHMAIEKNNLELVKFLVRMGADIHITDNAKCTPLDLARKRKDDIQQEEKKKCRQFPYDERILDFLQEAMSDDSGREMFND